MKNIAETRPSLDHFQTGIAIGILTMATTSTACANPPIPTEQHIILPSHQIPTYQESLSVDYIIDSLTKLLTKEIPQRTPAFNNEVGLVTLAEAIHIHGSALENEQKIILTRDFPDSSVGWLVHHLTLDPKNMLGPYQHFARVTNPNNEISFWTVSRDRITGILVFFYIGGPDNWRVGFFVNGTETEGNKLFERYLPTTENSPDGFI